MGLKLLKPTTASRRGSIVLDYAELTKRKPEKSLLTYIRYKAGRNTRGKLTVRHRGGRVKRMYRVIDFKRDKYNVPAKVEAIEYDPYRTAFIALLVYADGERRYILSPDGVQVGDQIMAGENAPIKAGNALPIKKIPLATMVHNVEIKPGNGGILGRSAGATIQIQGGAKGYVQLKMPSGEIRLVRDDCYATIGIVGNQDHRNERIGKAGIKRKMGFRPTVRGVAMSGGTHPHGDGQGKSGRHGPGGPAKDKWGNRIGIKTRKNKLSRKYVVQPRPNKKGKKTKKYKTII